MLYMMSKMHIYKVHIICIYGAVTEQTRGQMLYEYKGKVLFYNPSIGLNAGLK